MKRIIILSACLAILGLALSCNLPGWGQPDNNANLSSLTPSHGSLSPAFSASITNYILVLDSSVSEVIISGTPVSSSSTVSSPVTLSNIEPGIIQTATITVTAQSGLIKAYTIEISHSDMAVEFTSIEFVTGYEGSVPIPVLRLSFSLDPVGLTADHITITGATKGTLSGIGRSRSIRFSDVTIGTDESFIVALDNPDSIFITPSSRSYWVPNNYYLGVSSIQADGENGIAPTGFIELSFNDYPMTLSSAHITVTGATKGALTVGSTALKRKLQISNITVGNGEKIGVSLSEPPRYRFSTIQSFEVAVWTGQ